MYSTCLIIINNIYTVIKNWLDQTQDGGGGVSGSYTNLLPGPIWNYNKTVEKSA